MQTIVLATGNAHKLKEFREMLPQYNIITMKDIGFLGDIVEDGNSFLDNSYIKASTIAKYLRENNLDYWVMADDSGICCEALSGMPGIYSARYAGLNATDEDNRQKLLSDLKDVDNRKAYFSSVIICIRPDGKYTLGEGYTSGLVVDEYRGDTSFGYDCIFYSNDLSKTFGEASAEEKNSVSHRNRALVDLIRNIDKDDWRDWK